MKHRLNTDKKVGACPRGFHRCFIGVSSVAKKPFLGCLLAALLTACTQPQKSGSSSAPPALRAVTSLAAFPAELPLLAGSAPHRILVTGTDNDGFERPAPAKFSSDNPAVATVGPDGKVRPLTAGSANITAKFAGKSASVKVTVKANEVPSTVADTNAVGRAVLSAPVGQPNDPAARWGQTRPTEAAPQVSFINDVMPILSKAGCNSGSCHAKADGQNGFKLTIFAYDPRADYHSIIKGARGRRVFPAVPEESLLLKKATLAVPHDGGLRIERNSEEFRTLANWIAQGMPYSRTNEPALLGIEVFPKERRYRREHAEQHGPDGDHHLCHHGGRRELQHLQSATESRSDPAASCARRERVRPRCSRAGALHLLTRDRK